MIMNIHSFKNNVSSKLSLILLFSLVSFTSAVAGNTVKIEDFTIKPGTEETVAVNLDNTDPITSLQMDFTLSEGLTCTGATRNGDRIDRSAFQLKFNILTSSYRVGIFSNPTNTDAFSGNTGTIFYLTIKADANFSKKGTIKISNITASDINAKEIKVDGSYVTNVSPLVGNIATTNMTLKVKPDSSLTSVELILNNDINAYGLQGDITLPEGMDIAKNAKGAYIFSYGDRLPEDFSISSNKLANGKVRFIVAAMGAKMTGNSGKVLSFNVVANKSLADNSELIFSNVLLTGDENGTTYTLNPDTIHIVNIYNTQYLPTKAIIDALTNLYKTSVDSIAKAYPDVKDSTAILNAEKKIGNMIAAMQNTLDNAYASGNLDNAINSIASEQDQVKASINTLIADAAAAQKKFDADKAKKAANETAFATLSDKIKKVQAQLDDAIKTINTDCKHVAAKYEKEEAAIQAKIDSVMKDVKAKYAAIALTAESTVDMTSIEDEIANMLAEAIKAESTATGINASVISKYGYAVIYSASGEKLSAPVKGQINIFKYADGQVKKIYVK